MRSCRAGSTSTCCDSPLLQFLGREVNYMGLADLLVGAAVFALAYHSLGLQWSGWQWTFWTVAVLSGTVIETCIALLIGALSFWTGRSQSLYTIALRFHSLTSTYPLDMFGKPFRIAMTCFLPVAFMNYFPLTALLGKSNAVGIPWLGLISPVVAGVLVAVAALVWRAALDHYSGSGT